MSAKTLASLPFPHLSPVALQVGPIAVRWYGLAYLAGFALGYASLRQRARSGRLPLEPATVSDFVTWLVMGVVLGGRLGWWLVYHRRRDSPEPWYEAIALWHGGMSFHGGLVGVAIAVVCWSRLKHQPFLALSDAVALAVPPGLFFGRIANFINAELVGRPTDVPWAILFPGESVARHPSQLYEAFFEGLVLWLCLWLLSRARLRTGMLSAAFVILYSVFRFGVEFTRSPDPQVGYVAFGWLTMGQVLSLSMGAVGVALFALVSTTEKAKTGNSARTC